MPYTWFRGNLVKRWVTPQGDAKRGYFRDRLVFVKEYVINITNSDHNFNPAYLYQWMLNYIGNWNNKDNVIKIVVHPGVQLVSYDPTVFCMGFIPEMVGNTINIENHGYILGRGGSGGQAKRVLNNQTGLYEVVPGPGVNGADGIQINGPWVNIWNYGIIGGGGGGGGASSSHGGIIMGSFNNSPGGGGAPFGYSPKGSDINFQATFTEPARGSYSTIDKDGATGGHWGEIGQSWPAASVGSGSVYTPGNAGYGVRVVSGGVTWYVRGDIRGNAP